MFAPVSGINAPGEIGVHIEEDLARNFVGQPTVSLVVPNGHPASHQTNRATAMHAAIASLVSALVFGGFYIFWR
jgi:hypothetical protein